MSISKTLKKILFHRITKNIAIFALGFFIGAALIVSRQPRYETPEWAIITEEDTNTYPYRPTKIFNKRVGEVFPAGYDEKKLIRTLQKGGFQMDWYAPNSSKKVHLITKKASCEVRREIVWTINSSTKKIAGVTGSYWEICDEEEDVNAAQ